MLMAAVGQTSSQAPQLVQPSPKVGIDVGMPDVVATTSSMVIRRCGHTEVQTPQLMQRSWSLTRCPAGADGLSELAPWAALDSKDDITTPGSSGRRSAG